MRAARVDVLLFLRLLEECLAAVTLAERAVVHGFDGEQVGQRRLPEDAQVGARLLAVVVITRVLGELPDERRTGVAHLRRLALVAFGEHLGTLLDEQLGLGRALLPEPAVVAIERVVAPTYFAAVPHSQGEQAHGVALGGVELAVVGVLAAQVRVGRLRPLLELRRVRRPKEHAAVVQRRVVAHGAQRIAEPKRWRPLHARRLHRQRLRFGAHRAKLRLVEPADTAAAFEEVVDRVQRPALLPESRPALAGGEVVHVVDDLAGVRAVVPDQGDCPRVEADQILLEQELLRLDAQRPHGRAVTDQQTRAFRSRVALGNRERRTGDQAEVVLEFEGGELGDAGGVGGEDDGGGRFAVGDQRELACSRGCRGCKPDRGGEYERCRRRFAFQSVVESHPRAPLGMKGRLSHPPNPNLPPLVLVLPARELLFPRLTRVAVEDEQVAFVGATAVQVLPGLRQPLLHRALEGAAKQL